MAGKTRVVATTIGQLWVFIPRCAVDSHGWVPVVPLMVGAAAVVAAADDKLWTFGVTTTTRQIIWSPRSCV